MTGFARDFDPALLGAPLAERKAAFSRVRLRHPMLDDVIARVLRFLQSGSDRNIIAILGPSGVGKTAMLRSLERQVLKEYAARMLSDPSFIPCTYIELAAATGSAYNFDDFLYRAIYSLKDPYLDSWSSDVIAARAADNGDDAEFWAALRVSTHLRLTFESAVRFRKPIALFIDEVNHILKTSRDRTPLDQSNAMKSFANLTATQIVAAGTEAAIELFEGDGQIGRRAPVVPFHAYPATEDGRTAYYTVARNFLARMPVASIDEDVYDEAFLFAGGVGLIGTLRGWLCDAYAVCLDDRPARFMRKHLETTRLKTQVLHKLIDNIELARDRLKDGDFGGVMARLGVSGADRDDGAGGSDAGASGSTPTNESKSAKKPKRQKRRVGHRKPSKDPIGLPPGGLDVAP